MVRRLAYPRRLEQLYDYLDRDMVQATLNQLVNNSTVLVPHNELKVPLLKDAKYRISGVIFFDTDATADFKWRHTGPAAPTLVRIARRSIIPGTTAFAGIAVDTAFSGSDITEVGTGTNGGVIFLEGIIHNGANAGTFGFSFAQNTATVADTHVRIGSHLSATLIGS